MSDPSAWNNLGVLYHAKGLWADAVQAFLRALRLAPRLRTAARNLAVAAARPGAADAPVARLVARLAADATDREARRELARLERLLGRPDAARAHLAQLLADDPDDVVALRESGLLEQGSGDLRAAQRWLERSLIIAPDDPWAHLHLAEVLYHRGANEAALRVLDALDRLESRLADAWLLRCFVLGEVGRDTEARDAWRRAVALDPAFAARHADLRLDPSDGAMAGTWPVPAPDLETGDAATGRAGAPRPAVPALTSLSLGLAFRQQGHFHEAQRVLEHAQRDGEEAALVDHALAELALLQGRPEDARARYEALLTHRPDDPRLRGELGVACHQAGDLAHAVTHYRRALRADPRDALAMNNLGVALADLGRPDAAREALQQAARLDPSLAGPRLNLARWHLARRDVPGALEVLRALLASQPRLAEAWHLQAVALGELARLDEARGAAWQAIGLQPDHAEARYTLATIHGRLGDADEALRELQRALPLAALRRPPRLAVAIVAQAECPEAVGQRDLLTLPAQAPLAGTRCDGQRLATLLPERPALWSPPPGDHARRRGGGTGTAGGCAGGVHLPLPAVHDASALVDRADAFATSGLHGEAGERYALARRLLDAAPGRAADQAVLRRALRGEIRSACLLGRGADAAALAVRLVAGPAAAADDLALVAAAQAARGDADGRRVALRAIRRLLEQPGTGAALLHFVGDVADRLDEPALAILLYRRALAVDPTRPSPRLAIARLLRASGDLLAAHLELVAALAASPGWPDATRALAALHLAAARPTVAVDVLIGHLGHHPTDLEAVALLADALREAGRDEAARHAVQRVRRHQPEHPLALFLDGALEVARGRRRDAMARWTRLLEVAPDSEVAPRARAALAALREDALLSWRDVATHPTLRS